MHHSYKQKLSYKLLEVLIYGQLIDFCKFLLPYMSAIIQIQAELHVFILEYL